MSGREVQQTNAWMAVEADVSKIMTPLSRIGEEFARKEGVPLSLVPFVLKAVVNAVKEHPRVNARLASEKSVIQHDVHISLPALFPDAGAAPIIRHADRKSIAGLAVELESLARKAVDDLTYSAAADEGGTLSFRDAGAYGAVLSRPPIAPAQAASLSLGLVVPRVAAIQDRIAIRSITAIGLTYDCRMLDEWECGAFLQQVKERLERMDAITDIF